MKRLKSTANVTQSSIGAPYHFEFVIGIVTKLFGLLSAATLAAVIGVLTEVSIMLMSVKFYVRMQPWFLYEPTRDVG